ncbi:MAG: rod-binding protein [Epsilonproteobacteria bacterium]|nr:rod-binding protein [Campylobacterota bacterium]
MFNSIDNSIAFSYADAVKIPTKMDINNDVKLKKETDAFEAFFIKKILDVSLKHDNKLFAKDAGDKIYNSMYNDAISRAMGGKFGLSQMLFDFLKHKG